MCIKKLLIRTLLRGSRSVVVVALLSRETLSLREIQLSPERSILTQRKYEGTQK